MSHRLVPAVIIFKVDNFKFFEMSVLFTIAAVAGCFPPGDGLPVLKAVGPKFGSLEASFDGIANISFLGGEGRDFMSLLFGFVAIFAAAGLGRIAFGVVPALFIFLFYFRLEEIERLIHSS